MPNCGCPRPSFGHPLGVREVRGWIFDDNLTRVVEYITSLVQYNWDELDSGALDAGIPSTNADLAPSTWFEYPIAGVLEISLRIACDQGAGILSVIVSGEIDEVLAARFETLLDLH